MGLKRTLARNALWNYALIAVTTLAGFVVAPFLIHQLGRTGYGLWIVIGSFTGYLSLLDLGIRSAVGRNLAFYRARGDQPAVNGLLSTALALMSLFACLTAVASIVGQPLFFLLFDVPAAEVPAVRVALVLVGVNLALYLIQSIFDGNLWAMQRFDVLGPIDIAITVLRVGATFWLVRDGAGLIVLATITLSTTVLTCVAKAVAGFRLEPGLRVGIGLVGRGPARQLFGYGIWNFLLSVGGMVTQQLAPLIVAARLGLALTTPFAIATRLIGYAHMVFFAGHGVLTPLATSLHAQDKHDQQKKLFLIGSRYSLALSLFLMTCLIFLGRTFLHLWVGPELDSAFSLVVILALGELLPLSQGISQSMLLALGKHRGLALCSVVENVCCLGIAYWLIGSWGLPGMAVALAIPGFLGRGVVRMLLACHWGQVSLGELLRRSLVPALAAAAAPVALLAWATSHRQPGNWPELVVFGGLYAIVFAGSCLLVFADGRQLLARACRRLPLSVGSRHPR